MSTTGLGLSFETAEWLRWVLIGLCVLALAYLVATRGGRGILRLAAARAPRH